MRPCGRRKNKKKKKRFASVSRVCAKSLTIESRSRWWSMSRQTIHRFRRSHSRPLFSDFASLISGMNETVCLENSMSVDGSGVDYHYVEESMGGSDEVECLPKSALRKLCAGSALHLEQEDVIEVYPSFRSLL
jgi:hypothetical protein